MESFLLHLPCVVEPFCGSARSSPAPADAPRCALALVTLVVLEAPTDFSAKFVRCSTCPALAFATIGLESASACASDSGEDVREVPPAGAPVAVG